MGAALARKPVLVPPAPSPLGRAEREVTRPAIAVVANATAAPTGGDRVETAEEVTALADQLTELLTRETALVRAMRITEIGPLQPEKLRLAQRYQRLIKDLATATAPLPPALTSRAMRAGHRLAQAAVENERMLRVGQAATDRLIAAIATAIKRQRPATAGYTTRKSAPRSASVAGIAVDRRL
jgi:hypothetical protein